MRQNLIDSTGKINAILKEKIEETADINKKVIHVLKQLPNLINSNTKKGQKRESILEMELQVIII